MAIVDNAWRPATGKDTAYFDADFVVVFTSITNVSEVLLVHADGLDVDLLCAAFTLDCGKTTVFSVVPAASSSVCLSFWS